tara:strand:- start:2176 stop:3327 length:1152 start_codon:yes stop_codon:yes gene_type:complete
MKIKQNLKEITAIGSSNIVGTGATSFFWFYLASIISTEEYGEIFFYLGIASIISAVVLFANQNTITVYVAKKIHLQTTLYLISLCATSIASIVLIIWFFRIDVGIVLIGYVLNTLAISELLGKKYFTTYSKFFILQRGLVVLLGLGSFYVFGIDGILYAIGISYFVYIIIVFRGLKNEKLNFSLLKQNIGFVSNNYSFGIIQITRSQIDKIIIPAVLGFSMLGNYALALQIMVIMHMFPGIVYKFILPHDATGNKNKKIKVITVLVSIAFASGGIIFAPIIIPLLFPQFLESITAIQIMSITAIPVSITFILTSKFLGMEKSRYVLISRLISLTIISTGMVVLGTYFGLVGLALTYLIANTVDSIFLIIMNTVYHKKNISNDS